jgi:hypothetical protein
MVLKNNGHGVGELEIIQLPLVQHHLCCRVTVMVLESNGYGARE